MEPLPGSIRSERTPENLNWNANRTQSLSVPPPISLLNHDLLLSIFKINTNLVVLRKGCLKTLLEYTHVCSIWRQVILRTPSLWGHTIDIGNLSNASFEWRKEVLTRSGGSTLWIVGTVGASTSVFPFNDPVRFIHNLLEAYWDRIERLDITLPSAHCHKPVDYTHWPALFLRPSPRLKVFKINISFNPFDPPNIRFLNPLVPKPLTTTSPPSRLFDNYAPLLVDFAIVPSFPKSPRVLWLGNLRAIQLGPPLGIQELFRTVARTPQIEFIDLTCPEYANPNGTDLSVPPYQHIVSLRHLQKLCINGTLEHILYFFDHHNIPAHCSVKLNVSPTGVYRAQGTELPPLKYLARVIHGYFQHYQPTSISIVCRDNKTLWICDTTWRNGTQSREKFFYIQIGSEWDMNGSEAHAVVRSVVEAFNSYGYVPSSVKELEFDYDLLAYSPTRGELLLLPRLAILIHFLCSFSCIDTLYSDTVTLDHLVNVLDPIKGQNLPADVLFPALKKIKRPTIYSGAEYPGDSPPRRNSASKLEAYTGTNSEKFDSAALALLSVLTK